MFMAIPTDTEVVQVCPGCDYFVPSAWPECRRCGTSLAPDSPHGRSIVVPAPASQGAAGPATDLLPSRAEAVAQAPPSSGRGARSDDFFESEYDGPRTERRRRGRRASRRTDDDVLDAGMVDDGMTVDEFETNSWQAFLRDLDPRIELRNIDFGQFHPRRLGRKKLLLIGIAMVVLLGGCFVITRDGPAAPSPEIAAYVNGSAGVPYQSVNRSFQVMMPGPTQLTTDEVEVAGGTASIETVSSPTSGEGLNATVVYIEHSGDGRLRDQFLRRELEETVGRLPGAEIGDDEEAEFRGMAATDFDVEYAFGSGKARIAARDSYAVIVVALSRGPGAGQGFEHLTDTLVLAADR
jgi:hypothetical protein